MPASAEDEVPADAVLIREVRLGLFPEASSLHPGFVPGIPRVRLTLDLGAHLRGRTVPIYPEGREALLDLCPRLLEHDCGAGDEIRLLLATDGTGSAGVPTAGPDGDERGGRGHGREPRLRPAGGAAGPGGARAPRLSHRRPFSLPLQLDGRCPVPKGRGRTRGRLARISHERPQARGIRPSPTPPSPSR